MVVLHETIIRINRDARTKKPIILWLSTMSTYEKVFVYKQWEAGSTLIQDNFSFYIFLSQTGIPWAPWRLPYPKPLTGAN